MKQIQSVVEPNTEQRPLEKILCVVQLKKHIFSFFNLFLNISFIGFQE